VRKVLRLEAYKAAEERNRVRQAWQSQKSRAETRGIRWKLTFEAWCDIWLESGKWAERGNGPDQYCMHRLFDIGPYSVDNVEIITNRQNRKFVTKITRA
jgi:O-methyltransferase involved in polyketide biosynthesis